MKKRVRRESLIGEGDVDLTPLIDCVFLLLIFFMVTTVFIEVQGLVVDLPSSADSQEEQQQKKDVNILVSGTGEFTVAGTPSSRENLASAIKGAMDEANNRNVIIQGEPEALHKSIVYAMDMATSVGAEQLAFAIEQDEEQ
jgi:biopolymer transport protein ExbD